MSKPQLPPDDGSTWKQVPEYAYLYASEDGRIWSARSGDFKRQIGTPNGKGYRVVYVWDSGRDRLRRVHRMVASALHGPAPTEEHTVDHINGNKADNRAENLRWATPLKQADNVLIPPVKRFHWSGFLA